MSNVKQIEKNSGLKQCEFIYCNNKFSGPPQQKYCDDPGCKAARLAIAKEVRKTKNKLDTTNLTLTKGQFQSGTILRIRCAACGPTGRCNEKIIIAYDPKRTVYPKYCNEHRNAYKRARFEGKE